MNKLSFLGGSGTYLVKRYRDAAFDRLWRSRLRGAMRAIWIGLGQFGWQLRPLAPACTASPVAMTRPVSARKLRCADANTTSNGASANRPQQDSLPTCNASAALCMSHCVARSSHLHRAKFIPQVFIFQRSIVSQNPAMTPGLLNKKWKVT